MASNRRFARLSGVFAALVIACGPSLAHPPDGDAAVPLPDGGAPPAPAELRVPDRALVEWLRSTAEEPWWIEERIAPQPRVVGDRDLGPRSIVRAAPERVLVWQPPETDRLTDACRHGSGEWSAVGVDDDRRVFLAHGDASGLHDRVLLDDPDLATDGRAWLEAPRDVPRIGALSEASPSIVADGEDVVVALVTEDFAVLVYRFTRSDGAFTREARTLASPARIVTPFLPIGGSFDDFDSFVAPYVLRLAADASGRAFIALFADRGRLTVHNAAFGTSLALIHEVLGPREMSSDALLLRIDRDGAIGFARVLGTADVEDEIFGIAVGERRVAVLGRSRRELGRDNTEIHAMIAEADLDGTPITTTTFDTLDSGLVQTGAYVGDDLWIGGTEGWVQNPTGRSVFEPGQPLLARLRDAEDGARAIERRAELVPPTEGAAELRALRIDGDRVFLGGHERGPLTHTGDHDESSIRCDAYFRIAPLP